MTLDSPERLSRFALALHPLTATNAASIDDKTTPKRWRPRLIEPKTATAALPTLLQNSPPISAVTPSTKHSGPALSYP
jgi:hypothetical protein